MISLTPCAQKKFDGCVSVLSRERRRIGDMERFVPGKQRRQLRAQRRRWRPLTQKGDRVAFLISDAFLPESEEARSALTEGSEVEGTVVDFSDSGTVARAFALVEVVRKQTVVVPVEKLRALEQF